MSGLVNVVELGCKPTAVNPSHKVVGRHLGPRLPLTHGLSPHVRVTAAFPRSPSEGAAKSHLDAVQRFTLVTVETSQKVRLPAHGPPFSVEGVPPVCLIAMTHFQRLLPGARFRTSRFVDAIDAGAVPSLEPYHKRACRALGPARE